MDTDSYIGFEYPTPKGGILKVVGKTRDIASGREKLICECSICSSDKELFNNLTISKHDIKKGTFPCACSQKYRYNEYQYSVLINRICKTKGLTFTGWFGEYKKSKTKISFVCNSCGNISNTSSINNMMNKPYSCPSCGIEKYKEKRKKKNPHELVSSKCDEYGYSFIGFCGDEYINWETKVRFMCPEHGEINSIRYHDFVNSGQHCPKCSGRYSHTKEEVLDKLNYLCMGDNLKFVCFTTEYDKRKSKTKFFYECKIHGIREGIVSRFISSGHRCKLCNGAGGYNKNIPGSFYIFEYTHMDRKIYKFGITNRDIYARSKEHVYGLDGVVSRCIYSKKYMDGKIPLGIERKIKRIYNTKSCEWLYSGNSETLEALNDYHVILWLINETEKYFDF